MNVAVKRDDGTELRLLIVSPKRRQNGVPGLLWIHGGGYAVGMPEQDKAYMERFVQASSCVIVSPEYRLSVEAPYPAALEDCYLALKWLKDHAQSLGIREDQLFIGGESAGGGLAAAVTLYARDKNEVAIAFQMPFYPMLDDRFITASSTGNDAPVWNSKSNELAWRKYLGHLTDKEAVSIYAAPARCTDYNDLPPICSFVGTLDPFYDETVAYVRQIEEVGIKTHFMVFEGAYHGFDVVAPESAIAKMAVDFYMESFKYAVGHYFAPQSFI